MLKYQTAEECIKNIRSDERIFIHGGAATPLRLVNALVERRHELRNIEIVHMHTEGEAPYAHPEYADAFRVNSFFIGSNIRNYVEHNNVQYIPIFLSEVPR